MDVKKYLEEHKIETANKLVSHIIELKRNTKPNLELISHLADYIQEMCVKEYTEFPPQETFNKYVNYMYLEEPKRPKEWTVNTTEKEVVKNKELKSGVKQNQTEQKAPIFTYCKVNKNALEALSLRALYGHNKYKQFDQDWQNFTRVENGDFEYSNAEFRHSLGIGGGETEEEHLIAAAWNAVARLEIYFRNKLNKS